MLSDPLGWHRIQDAFHGALERDGAGRDSYLQHALGDDAELIAEVEAMLRAHESLAPLEIEKRLLGADGDGSNLSGARVGAYRLVRLIARGGMGEVYAAEREGAPYRQQVAFKLAQQGLVGPEAQLRFRQERQILARLVHPFIVPILDGGITEDQRPYLVMQYVDGVPITTFCETNECGLERRLRLFCDVIRAVEHAHKNLVVHRDLKPSNVLVTSDAEPQLLDFGVAKLLDPSDEEATLITRVDSRIMTLDYAAPEQIQGGAITTATDVYALGVLLYELLTGQRPFCVEGGTRAALERRILEETPAVPSAAARQTKGEVWAKRLRSDLDTIILKAMAKEPEQRYSSARELAGDIERFMSGQPILARKPSLSYRLGKFVTRNRLASAVAAVSLLLLLSIGAMLWLQSRRIARERDIARSEQEKADRIVTLLVDFFSSADPEYLPGGRDITIGEFLRNAESALGGEQVDAGVQARLRHALGKVYMARSQFPQARGHLETALEQLRETKGADDPATAAVMHDLAKLALQTRPKAEAAVLLRQSLDLHRRLYQENHPLVAQCLHDLADAVVERSEKRSLIEKALALRRGLFPSGHISVSESLLALGVYYYENGELERAEREFEAAVTIAQQAAPQGHPSALWAMNDLAVIRLHLGRFREAEQLQRALLAEKRRIHGDETVPVAVVWGNLGTVLAATGKYGECEKAFRTARTLFVKLLGPEHTHVANATRNLARVRMFRGDYRDAANLFREATELHRKVNGPDAGYWYMRGQAAAVTAGLGQTTAAERELRLVLQQLSTLGVHAARKSDAQVSLGFALLDAGRAGEAEAVLAEALEVRNKSMPREHPAIAEAYCGLGAAMAAQGKPEGREMVRRSLPKYRTWGLAVYASRAAAWL